jgi:hypothetical protein
LWLLSQDAYTGYNSYTRYEHWGRSRLRQWWKRTRPFPNSYHLSHCRSFIWVRVGAQKYSHQKPGHLSGIIRVLQFRICCIQKGVVSMKIPHPIYKRDAVLDPQNRVLISCLQLCPTPRLQNCARPSSQWLSSFGVALEPHIYGSPQRLLYFVCLVLSDDFARPKFPSLVLKSLSSITFDGELLVAPIFMQINQCCNNAANNFQSSRPRQV